MAIEKLKPNYKKVEILPSAARVISGISDEFYTYGYNELDAAIKATADTALTSLDADVEAYDPTINDWVVIGSFTQIVATPSTAEGINILTGLRYKCRINYTFVGTSITFAVGVILRV